MHTQLSYHMQVVLNICDFVVVVYPYDHIHGVIFQLVVSLDELNVELNARMGLHVGVYQGYVRYQSAPSRSPVNW